MKSICLLLLVFFFGQQSANAQNTYEWLDIQNAENSWNTFESKTKADEVRFQFNHTIVLENGVREKRFGDCSLNSSSTSAVRTINAGATFKLELFNKQGERNTCFNRELKNLSQKYCSSLDQARGCYQNVRMIADSRCSMLKDSKDRPAFVELLLKKDGHPQLWLVCRASGFFKSPADLSSEFGNDARLISKVLTKVNYQD